MWLYLEPIFNSDENNKDLVKEKKQFKKDVHKPFCKFCKDISDSFGTILKKINIRDTITMNSLKDINRSLEQLEKQLIDYLDKKRSVFPRFYFVSNDDLIEILSQAKDFNKVQGHLSKLFEAIKVLELDKTGSTINSMVSPEQEKLAFVMPLTLDLNGGITDVLNKIEEAMKDTVKNIIKQSSRNLRMDPSKRVEWLLDTKNCAQSILTTDAINWTMSTEACLETDDVLEEIENLYESMLMDLKDVIELVRTNLSNRNRRMINSLITQDVHYRDIVDELREDEIDSKDDFKWQANLRFYATNSSNEVI